ncbi:Spy/CpxP family protein refolding chaperone [Hymenobacter weizhouensis]|uniref:Spy/CpxP family protein refolding chaperone n=1 Tax=Hymenobacter sp. YIM 151500-1 TaxID=2987689 RepID=UPI002226F9B4|nr:Spy/CpxP family protein refolding chaperone [Hymenobacter sp. YIM 151500-1]UYZ63741.1 Spy/CpxP family protein refolding chaperone [Hymenobacter sp. YIM 151500-1]
MHFPFFLRRLSLLSLLWLAATALHAQQAPPRPDMHTRIENARIAYITRELNLTSEQAQRFWPLYNEYSTKRRELRQTHDQLRNAASATLSEDQARATLKQIVAVSKNELELTEDYFSKLQKAISARQVAQLYKAEREFGRVMIQELKGQRRTYRLERPGGPTGAR